MISYMHSATVVVANQDAALDFYVNALGWEKALDVPMEGAMRFLTVVPPGARTQLVLGDTSWHGEDTRSTKSTGITLVAPDIDATYETLTARGVRFKEPVALMPWGKKATWFYDLDGNEFHLIEDE